MAADAMRSRAEEIAGDPGAIESANLLRRGNVQDKSNHHELSTVRGDEGVFGISRSGSLSSAIDHLKSRFDSSPTFYHHTPPARQRPGFLKRRKGTLQDNTGLSSPYTHGQRAKNEASKAQIAAANSFSDRRSRDEVVEICGLQSSMCSRSSVQTRRSKQE